MIKLDISIPEQLGAFISSGVWRDTRMRPIEFSIRSLFSLQDEQAWEQTVRA